MGSPAHCTLDRGPLSPDTGPRLNMHSRRTQRWLWVGLLLTLGLLFLAFLLANLRMRMLASKPLPILGTVADFQLTNQFGKLVTLADLRGHVWIADIFFTRCPGPCLKMSRQMKDLQNALPADSNARLVSITTDTRFDLPEILNKYSQQFGADSNRWIFLTGTQQEMLKLASNSLKLASIEKKPEEQESPLDLFVHSTIFVVVDKQGRLRGIFETTGEQAEPRLVQKEILETVHRLEREKK
jgi:protein SCO1